MSGLKYLLYGLFIFLGIFNIGYYLNQYFVQQNYYYAYDWQYGYEKAIPEIQKLKGEYKHIVVSDKQPLDKSYMFFLFHLNYPPQEYQKIEEKRSLDVTNRHYFDTYEFYVFDWEKEKNRKDTLFVGSPNDFPSNIMVKKTISYPNGKPAIMIVDPKDNK